MKRLILLGIVAVAALVNNNCVVLPGPYCDLDPQSTQIQEPGQPPAELNALALPAD